MNPSLLPTSWTPACSMRRIICHWSEGRNLANDTDRAHYHLLIEQLPDGTVRVIRGDHSIADNANTSDGDYAAHTRSCNTGSIGVALCGMMGCNESPFRAGPAPITQSQWNLMAQVIAILCQRYRIEVTPKTVLCHGEVQANLGIRQRGKWDPMRWPWNPDVPGNQIGDLLREQVRDLLDDDQEPTAPVSARPVSRVVHLPNGNWLGGEDVLVEDGSTFVSLRPLATLLGWTVGEVTKTSASVTTKTTTTTIPLIIEGSTGFVSVHDVAKLLGGVAAWDAKSRSVSISERVG